MRTEVFTVALSDPKKIAAFKSFLKALQVPFRKASVSEMGSPYRPEFVEKILNAKQEIRDGRGTSVPLNELDSFLGL